MVRGADEGAELNNGGLAGQASSGPPADPRADHARPLRLLFVDDEERILSTHKRVYEHIGFVVDTAATGVDAIALAKRHAHDAFLVDVHMAPHDGNWTCERLLELDPESVVIMLSGVETDEAVLAAFAAGALDYLFKGTSPIKLAAHIRRRVADRRRCSSTVLRFGRLVADRATQTVLVDGALVLLGEKEFSLLWLLLNTPRKCYTARELHDKALGGSGKPNSVRKVVERTRRKLGDCGCMLLNAPGRGYCFNPSGHAVRTLSAR